ncbi:class I SAM-dependent methyltransferase [Thalassococcus sp. BH17M4-6]|uniref:class I SAM-dependent methyltransferase n=1 Tax=Thalassococcus sp. BH17M4-6 TaxID=3413148 RepID=UPI003BE14B26
MNTDYLSVNRDVWDRDAANWAEIGARHWALEDPIWGNWGLPESSLGLLPEDMRGLDAIELGCGTGYVAGWMARRGARVTAIDLSGAQLATARDLAWAHDADITFLHGNAEATELSDAAFDFAISEYGAAIWCRPELWLAEAWRLLRPGGRLVFLGNHPLSLVCSPESGAPCDRTLHRPYRGMWGADWSRVEIDPSGVCFNLTMGNWFALFAKIGFRVENYQELYAPDHADHTRASVPADWAKVYPIEQVWHLVKPG